MFHERRDAAVRLALKMARLPPLERRSARFVWTVEGKVRRLPVACSRSGDVERRLQLQSDPVK